MSYTQPYGNDKKILCPFCHTITTFTEYLDTEGGYFEKVSCNSCGKSKVGGESMELYGRFYYEETCSNGHSVFVLTQQDDGPEYYTTVIVFCPECKEEVTFSLPVN